MLHHTHTATQPMDEQAMEESRSRQQSAGSAASSSSARFETFTEAVPLSLSSMAHASLPLQDGVLDGLRQVLSHTLLSCVNYARIVHPPHEWTFRDMCTSEFAWTPIQGEQPPRDLPFSLSKMNFQYQYTRNAAIYLKPGLPINLTMREELQRMKDWPSHTGILGKISLLYASKERLTESELDGTDTDDMPPTILYKIVVEYRSLPATGSQQAVQAEELSMLTFGGSVDDDVKYGALAALYDETAKYVLEIYSVRGKKYKFDLMDSTLSNGTIPNLPNSRDGGDPFVKSLCVTVTDHASLVRDEKYAITRMHLTLEGKPRRDLNSLPTFDFMTNAIESSFLLLDPHPPPYARATPSGHVLLLDPVAAGHVYVNGRYVTTWGSDPRVGSTSVALFGMDLHGIPFWNGRIVDYQAMIQAYAQLWYEILVDARLIEFQIASKLLHRLMFGRDPEYDEEEYDDSDEQAHDNNVSCLESQVLTSPQYDRVGIGAKALATRFHVEFGASAFPCLQREVEWVKTLLPDRKAVVVPQRLLDVLFRGGYFGIQHTADDLWYSNVRRPIDKEKELVLASLQMLESAGCEDVEPEHIVFTSGKIADDVVTMKCVCRYNEMVQQYCVHERFLDIAVKEYIDPNHDAEYDPFRVKAYLLGMYVAQAHPDGKLLTKYVLRVKPVL